MGNTPYTTENIVREFLGIAENPLWPGSPDAIDDVLSRIILDVSGLFDTLVYGPGVQGFANNISNRVAIVEYHDGGSSDVIMSRLITEQITGISERREDTLLEEDGVELVYGDTFFLGEFPSRTIFRTSAAETFDRVFSVGFRNVKVTFWPAYVNAPHDVERGCIEESARAYKASTTNTGDGGFLSITQRTADQGSTVSYTVDDLSATTIRMLEGYRQRLSFF
jgi:hypothetical protein